MAAGKERRSTPRKATLKPDTQADKTAGVPKRAAAPRTRTTEQQEAPLATSNVRAGQSADELRRQIAEAAYYRAKQRGFTPGKELEDWIQAESEVLNRNGLR